MIIRFLYRYETFEELVADREARIKKLKEQKGSLAHHASLKKSASVVYQRGIEIFDKAIKDRTIDDTYLRLIIDSMIVGENSDGTLSIDVSLNAPFLSIVKDIQSIDDMRPFRMSVLTRTSQFWHMKFFAGIIKTIRT